MSEVDKKYIVEFITDRIMESKFELLERIESLEDIVRQLVILIEESE